MAKKFGIIPPTGTKGTAWPKDFVLPQGKHGSLSVGGWTSGNEGFVQQTFLGASIRNFNINAGFGDSSTTMGIELVEDIYNESDKTERGKGDDVYHNGERDAFQPPVVGSPVFFKFGKNHASVEQAFRKTIDDIYEIDTLEMPENPFPRSTTNAPMEFRPEYKYKLYEKNDKIYWEDRSALYDPKKSDTKWRGSGHFAFGGILQSYVENKGSNGNPLYSVKLTDPREILSNAQLILNNYQGTTFDNKNLFNVYGFLEYDPGYPLIHQLDNHENLYDKDVLTKEVDDIGKVTFRGDDVYKLGTVETFDDSATGLKPVESEIVSKGQTIKISGEFPITGRGFSRRSNNGIPWYRIDHALDSLFNYRQDLPNEYVDAGFGGTIDFRGYNYVVDWGGIPTDQIPKTYYLNYDQINMLDLAQELCDVLSRDLFVSLLPVIDHPSMSFLFNKNQEVLAKAKAETNNEARAELLAKELVCGIIRLDSIDRGKQPNYGSIIKYLNDLKSKDIYVQNQDVGFEVSNVVTDKFIAGGQETEMYYFHNLRDRDHYFDRLMDQGIQGSKAKFEQIGHDKWTLDTNLKQQILPYYGLLGNKAVTIPRGFGSWQQILLDTQNLDVFGVGNYYVATEIELRYAAQGFTQWMQFLMRYNDVYMEEVTEGKAFYSSLFNKTTTEIIEGINDQIESDSIKTQLNKLKNRDFAVTVPRCVWNSDKSPRTHELQVDPETDLPVVDEDGNEVFIERGAFKGSMAPENKLNAGYPENPCNPPYGYPLYYQRASSIGIPYGGVIRVGNAYQNIISNIAELQQRNKTSKQRFFTDHYMAAAQNIRKLEATVLEKRKQLANLVPDGSKDYDTAKLKIEKEIKLLQDQIDKIKLSLEQSREDMRKIQVLNNVEIVKLKLTLNKNKKLIANLSTYERQNLENAKKIHTFLKKIADDNLGKKFLVQIPKACNVNYNENIVFSKVSNENTKEGDGNVAAVQEGDGKQVDRETNWDIKEGPFGFEPKPIDRDAKSEKYDDDAFQAILANLKDVAIAAENSNILSTTAGSWGHSTVDEDGNKLPEEQLEKFWPTRSNIHPHYLDRDAFREQFLTLIGDPDDLVDDGEHELVFPEGYTYGALKCNFNPIAEKWEFNYLPEPQGGFFNYALFDENLKKVENEIETPYENLPKATREMLSPILMDKLVGENGRIKCYARFDHSQDLDVSQIDSSKISQQSLDEKTGKYVADPLETLPNQNPEQRSVLNQIQSRLDINSLLDRQGPSVAYVSAELDPKFYMAPKVVMGNATVWATEFSVKISAPPADIVWIKDTREKLDDPDSDDPDDKIDNPLYNCRIPHAAIPRVTPIFGVPKGGGLPYPKEVPDPEGEEGDTKLEEVPPVEVLWDDFAREYVDGQKGWIIKTKDQDLDPDHVFALITLPNKLIPTLDKRYVDSLIRRIGTDEVGHIMTEDVVKIDEFKEPAPIDNGPQTVDCAATGLNWTFNDLVRAEQASKTYVESISLADQEVNIANSSPVYPDMVAIPLMSKERCYGPWLSSALTQAADTEKKDDDGNPVSAVIKYSDIGGKIEFIKDEDLAPWNYGGYQLMNEAGQLKAKFSNSLLLFSERGSFTYDEAPTGIALGKALENDQGPLVTYINVNIGNRGISTSVKLDLYTQQFGKLQKQKEIAIAQINRERQKIIDTNNFLKRKGISKNQSANFPWTPGNILQAGGQNLINAEQSSTQYMDRANLMVFGSKKHEIPYDLIDQSMDVLNTGDMLNMEGLQGTMMSEQQLAEVRGLNFDQRQDTAKNQTHVVVDQTALWTPYTTNAESSHFASMPMPEHTASQKQEWNT